MTARLPHAGLIGLPGNPLAVMMIVQCVLLESVRSVFHLPETPAQTVEAILNVDIDPGIQENCASMSEAIRRFRLSKAPAACEFSIWHTALFASTVTDSRGAIA